MDEKATAEEPEVSRTGIQALDSALVVLRILAAIEGPASLKEIAQRAKMPASKVHRYLASFAKAGLVRQVQRAGLYDLAKGATELGLAAMARMDLVNEAADHLERLVAETGAAGLVAIWGPHGPTVVRWQRTGSFVITSLGLGTTLPLLNSASGRVFLAYSPPILVRDLLRAEIDRAKALRLSWPDLNPNRENEIGLLVQTVRNMGYASVDGRFIPGLNAISVPVLNWQGEVEAAVTLTAGDHSISEPGSPALALLRKVCDAVSVTGRPQLPKV
ncbi:helix-turn-helix domain-containing protein [Mesorhizobium sp.]|uniref:IclR family transcriptional regulator n=1 Tax=Mesorhizobium sp. TaxID=1871066 RepID=UPI000FE9EABD|nr:helix-turn-helix domain-containing protein [Mesorhizobium sp.]RWM45488.1 MAG: IclR family transcriptional regulator [Mesorhizobium sp.]RWM58192.1 MAG: IclR family transcriptional regulator [Mesorhizobium sp.]RWM58643.1 MAG: IclR family transcriptional regulator [Mesorhizobium sp.]TIO70058.1 MAG: IclR family transcriptional regulator [Mesorhizobium sp.]TJV93947.1 MAG: IclR family transcriptional regulator [Mesorhizobium sp.]